MDIHWLLQDGGPFFGWWIYFRSLLNYMPHALSRFTCPHALRALLTYLIYALFAPFSRALCTLFVRL